LDAGDAHGDIFGLPEGGKENDRSDGPKPDEPSDGSPRPKPHSQFDHRLRTARITTAIETTKGQTKTLRGKETVNLLDSGQLWIPTGERSGLLTHIAAMGSVSLCVRMKS
jgi:hypothetical protein